MMNSKEIIFNNLIILFFIFCRFLKILITIIYKGVETKMSYYKLKNNDSENDFIGSQITKKSLPKYKISRLQLNMYKYIMEKQYNSEED